MIISLPDDQQRCHWAAYRAGKLSLLRGTARSPYFNSTATAFTDAAR